MTQIGKRAQRQRSGRRARSEKSMSVEELKRRLTEPPSAEELAHRQAVIARTLEHRKDMVITPLTTADLVHLAREEEYQSYGSGR